MNITIEQVDYANPQQARQLADLLNAYASEPMGGGKPLPEDRLAALAPSLAQVPDAFSLIAYCNGEAVGFANCFQGFSTFQCRPLLNIHDIAVLSGYRGMGISQRLLASIEAIARQRNCCKITLEVLQGNQAAQQAYRKFGFAAYELDPQMGQALFWEKACEDIQLQSTKSKKTD